MIFMIREKQVLWGGEVVKQSNPLKGNILRLPSLKVRLEDIFFFTKQLATVYRAGIPLVRGMEVLSFQTENRTLKLIIRTLSARVRSGISLSRAMSDHPSVFSPVYVGALRVGEAHGDLAMVLEKLADFLEKEVRLKKRITQAMTYPAVVFGASILFTIFTFNYILPYFVQFFESLNVQLPFISKFMVFLTKALNNPAFVAFILFLIFGSLYALKCYFLTPFGRRQIDTLKLQIPLAGKLLKKVVLSRIANGLAVLLGGGVKMASALELAGTVSGNALYQNELARTLKLIKEGKSLYECLRQNGKLFPSQFAQMTLVGEESGELPEIFANVAKMYELDVEYALASFVSAIEPVLILVTGTVIGFIILSVFLPLYGVIQRLG